MLCFSGAHKLPAALQKVIELNKNGSPSPFNLAGLNWLDLSQYKALPKSVSYFSKFSIGVYQAKPIKLLEDNRMNQSTEERVKNTYHGTTGEKELSGG